MKNSIFTTFFFATIYNLFAQTNIPTLDWAQVQNGPGYEYGSGIVVDDMGNSYSIGSFRSTTDFDPSAQSFNMTPVGTEDIFILKLDIDGNFIWAKQIGGVGTTSSNDDDNAFQIVISNNNELILTGQFGGTADFDPSSNQYFLSSNGTADAFVAKYDTQGTFIWAKSLGGGNIDCGKSICVSNSGNIIVSGQSFGSVDFDPSAGVLLLTPSLPYSNGSLTYSTSCFTMKLTSNGDLVWANLLDDFSDEIGYVVCDAAENVYQVGRYAGNIDMDPSTSVYQLPGSNTYYSIYFRKLNSNGGLVWAKSFASSTLNLEAVSICIDNTNNIAITGYFYGVIDMDPSNAVYNLTSNGSTDVFIAKYDSDANLIFANSIGGNANGTESGASITTDESNNIYVIGYIESPGNTVDFDNSNSTAFIDGLAGTFLVKYNPNGIFDWVIRVEESSILNQVFYFWNSSNSGGGGATGGSCLVVQNGSIYINGAFSHDVDFDPSNMSYFQSTNGNQTDCFVHKLNFCQTSNITIDTTVCGNFIAPNGTSYNQTGTYYFQTTNVCDTNYTLNLVVNNQPITPVIYSNQQGVLYTQNQQNVNYQWYFCSDNILLANEVNDTLIPATSSLYYVTVQNQCGIDTSDCYFYEDVSIPELDKLILKIFPNPSSKSIQIESSIYTKEYSILNYQGQLVSKFSVSNKNQSIDISILKSGIYFVTDGLNFIRFVKE